MATLYPILIALAALGLLALGALFGAAINESEHKRKTTRPRVMELVEEQE